MQRSSREGGLKPRGSHTFPHTRRHTSRNQGRLPAAQATQATQNPAPSKSGKHAPSTHLSNLPPRPLQHVGQRPGGGCAPSQGRVIIVGCTGEEQTKLLAVVCALAVGPAAGAGSSLPAARRASEPAVLCATSKLACITASPASLDARHTSQLQQPQAHGFARASSANNSPPASIRAATASHPRLHTHITSQQPTSCLQRLSGPHHQLRQRADHAIGDQRLPELEILRRNVACRAAKPQQSAALTAQAAVQLAPRFASVHALLSA